MSNYTETLIKKVIDCSVGQTWDEAVQEWIIEDCSEDLSQSQSCVCGKEDLRYPFTIKNKKNGNTLFPIGSSCIKKFEREDLFSDAKQREAKFKLLHAIEDGQFIELSSELFSKKLILALYKEGAFNYGFNDDDGRNDYEFFLKMFNKRDKTTITDRQHRKINYIIAYKIKPFLRETIGEKISNELPF